ncbi:unnamed protein product [Musa acuminata subsp. malaccensis]|uniref:(wild Malaysian banana) hypothetical protein n=1 Tax=Musa acuminata subsp. malaccensis TaxID=214687 RepID=A0A804HN16_MUSAM|nr:unnamed protein product [Musa acuminata subsp. malaccensis]
MGNAHNILDLKHLLLRNSEVLQALRCPVPQSRVTATGPLVQRNTTRSHNCYLHSYNLQFKIHQRRL